MKRFQFQLFIALTVLLAATHSLVFFSRSSQQQDWSTEYGVDYSFPIHHQIDSSRYPYYASAYNTYLDGCYKMYSRRECDATEFDRLEMNLRQPASQHNYTEIGFKKLSVPKEAWEPLIEFYKANVHKEKDERWPRGNTYVNHWVQMTSMISFEDTGLRGGLAVKNKIWDAVRPVIEEWVGRKVEPTSLYGIRVYKNGHVLATHVDRLPLVSSAIIQVAQDVDEPWPLEVYDHAGRAHNVSMLPGDLVLYESHTVLHGRPFPLKGRYYANVFVHFKPVDHDQMNAQDILDAKKESDEKQKNEPSFLGKLFSKSQDGNSQRDHGGHEQTNHDAFRRTFRHDEAALREGAPNQEPSSNEKFIDISTGNDEHNNEEIHDEDINGEAGEEEGLDFNNIDGEPAVRYARLLESIEEDDFMAVMEIVEEDPTVLQIEDDNHWTALHEAIRAGNIEIVKYILSRGADPFKRVRGGGDAMEVARFSLPQGHEMFRVLKEHMQSKPQRV